MSKELELAVHVAEGAGHVDGDIRSGAAVSFDKSLAGQRLAVQIERELGSGIRTADRSGLNNRRVLKERCSRLIADAGKVLCTLHSLARSQDIHRVIVAADRDLCSSVCGVDRDPLRSFRRSFLILDIHTADGRLSAEALDLRQGAAVLFSCRRIMRRQEAAELERVLSKACNGSTEELHAILSIHADVVRFRAAVAVSGFTAADYSVLK